MHLSILHVFVKCWKNKKKLVVCTIENSEYNQYELDISLFSLTDMIYIFEPTIFHSKTLFNINISLVMEWSPTRHEKWTKTLFRPQWSKTGLNISTEPCVSLHSSECWHLSHIMFSIATIVLIFHPVFDQWLANAVSVTTRINNVWTKKGTINLNGPVTDHLFILVEFCVSENRSSFRTSHIMIFLQMRLGRKVVSKEKSNVKKKYESIFNIPKKHWRELCMK